MYRQVLALSMFAVCGIAAAGNRVEPLAIASGQGTTSIQGRVQGYAHVDYRLSARAGQTLRIRMATRHGANYFNVLPPGSGDIAMFADGNPDNAFERVLPDDGVYLVRVYLMRSAARRNETASFRLTLELAGAPLLPLSPANDALVRGTRFHARAPVPCAPVYAQVPHCEAGVIRRGRDGTASVVLRWGVQGTRRLLFIQGQAVSSDAADAMKVQRRDDWTLVEFDDGSRFEIPDALLTGG